MTNPPAGSATDHGGFSSLTARQMAVLEMVSRGLTNRQIGCELHMSRYTVAQHLKEVFKRTGSINRTDLVDRAYRYGALRRPRWP